ncbi:T9SS type A sorting domain-containing protein [bacterium]|nr:T9SS type A sorting domain-containing protein [bacterium]
MTATEYKQFVIENSFSKNEGDPKVPSVRSMLAALNQVDLSNDYSPSSFTKTKDNNDLSVVMMAPNPVKTSQATLYFSSLKAGLETQVVIFDLTGLQLKKKTMYTEIGQNSLSFDTGDLNNGAYLFTLETRGSKNESHYGNFVMLR